MSKISASPEELRGEARGVRERAETTEADIRALSARLAGLSNVFTGKAQQAFDDRYHEWERSAEALLEALDALGEFLSFSADTIEQTDQELARNLQG